MNSHESEPIEFVDPDTGEFYKVKPAKATVDAAYKLGFIPFTGEDMDRADAVDRDALREDKSWPPECTCSEDRNGGDPHDHAASCAWANAVLSRASREKDVNDGP